ncbi:MAG: BcpO-related WXXGXW repeat protein [Aureispira sp.]|nr:BcpO-related WXXGXW repeat protein [Aureispira sp.]
MKKLFAIFGLSMLIAISGLTEAQAQIVVKIKPARPKVIVKRPAQAKKGHVWVDGHWTWNKQDQKYRWVKGHWVTVKKGHKWVPGHWVDVRGRGHKWVPGHWKQVTTVNHHGKRNRKNRR